MRGGGLYPSSASTSGEDAEKGFQLRSQSFGRLNVLALYASAAELLAASLENLFEHPHAD
jgi:hypothetical protein